MFLSGVLVGILAAFGLSTLLALAVALTIGRSGKRADAIARRLQVQHEFRAAVARLAPRTRVSDTPVADQLQRAALEQLVIVRGIRMPKTLA